MLTDLVFALAARGHRITVVTSRLSYDDPSTRYPKKEFVAGVEVLRVATTGFGRTGLAGRALDYLTFYLAVAWMLLLKARRGDVIVAKTDPPLLSLAITPVARLRGARAVNWLQDIFPEVATKLGLAQGRIWRAPIAALRWWRDRTLRKAVLNVAIGERMASILRSLGVSSERIRIIPNWADGALVRPVAPGNNRLRQAWGLEDAFVVGYSGNLGRAHDMSTFVQAIALTEAVAANDVGEAQLAVGAPPLVRAAANARIAWLFVGGGTQLAKLRLESQRQDFASAHFHPYQPRERLGESLSVPDVHVITLRPELEGLIVPSKYYGIAAAGRPAIFIGDPQGEIGRILTESGTGFIVAEGDGDGLARAVRSLAEDRSRANEMGQRARALFEARYDVRFSIEAWEELLWSLQA